MASIVKYSITGSSLAPTTQASGVTGSSIANGSLSSFGAGNDGWASDPVVSCNPPNSTTTASLSVTKNSYCYITITPDSGKKISFSKIILNAGRGGSSTPRGLKIRSSVDSYAADLYSAELATYVPNWTQVQASLGLDFQAITSPITFRFYVWAPSSSYAVDMDDIDFTGDVADLSVIAGITGIAYASAKTVNGVLLGATGNVKGWNGNT